MYGKWRLEGLSRAALGCRLWALGKDRERKGSRPGSKMSRKIFRGQSQGEFARAWQGSRVLGTGTGAWMRSRLCRAWLEARSAWLEALMLRLPRGDFDPTRPRFTRPSWWYCSQP